MTASTGTSPFSRRIDVAALPATGADEAIEADHAECAAVAEVLDLPAVAAVAARLCLEPQPGGRIHVAGEVTARVTQVCVVSLEPFESDVEQAIDVSFAPPPAAPSDLVRPSGRAAGRHERRRGAGAPEPPATSAVVDGEDDPPDPIVDGCIDLGAVAVEFLALALDFYPRKPGVHFTDVSIGETDDAKPSAFAALQRLKDRS